MEIYRNNDTQCDILRKILTNQTNLDAAVQSVVVAIGGSGSLASSVNTGADVAVATPGTAVQGPDLACAKGVFVVARAANTGNIYVGGANVKNSGPRGIILSTLGMPSQIIPVANANLLWFDADVAGEGVGLIAL